MSSYEEMFAKSLRDEPMALSSAGQARRDAMRAILSAKVVSRRRQRRAIRASGVLGLAAAVIWMLIPTAAVEVERPETAAGYQNLAIHMVQDDPGLLARLRVEATALPSGIRINDAQLIDLLEAAQQPSGILRSGGRIILTEALVTEEPPD